MSSDAHNDGISASAEALAVATSKTFADMAFIDAVPASPPENPVDFSHILHIEFGEPNRGSLVLFLPIACKRLIVENVYGNDWSSLATEQIDDCLLEIINVLAGNLLDERFGSSKTYNLTLPRLLFDEQELASVGAEKAGSEHYFDAEGCLFKVFLEIGSPP